eukprot:Tbor_TRINITY_DN5672_c1_g4::TRINITY_DN5672_c1_g4_i1::g.9473::m.9473
MEMGQLHGALQSHQPSTSPSHQHRLHSRRGALNDASQDRAPQWNPRCSVYGFKVGEYFKSRSRPVWACHINDRIKQVPHYHLQTQSDVWRTIGKAHSLEDPIFIQFFLKSMYDQHRTSQ